MNNSKHFIDSEQAFPIYSFSAKWSEPIPKDKENSYNENWTEGLPDGRFWNSTAFDQMYGCDKTEEELQREITYWFEKYKEKKDCKSSQKKYISEFF